MAMSGGTAKLVKTGKLGDSSATCKLYVYYKTSQDTANNKSTITCGMYIVVTDGWSVGNWTDNSGSYVGTTKLTFSGAIPANTTGTTWLVENKSFSVSHNEEGKAFATIHWKWGVNSSWGNMEYPSGSFTITLPTIARKSSVSATDAYIGNKPTITISRKSSKFTHTLQYKINGQSSYTTIVSKINNTSYSSWAVPETAYNYISNGKATVTIKCITYSGSTNVGESTTTLTATAKEASNVKATSAYIGKTSTITIARNSSSFKHTLQYKIAGQSDFTTLINKTSNASYSWTLPTSIYNYIGSTEKSVGVTIRCYTYYGDVNLGNKTTTFTATCLENDCKPTLAPTVTDTGKVSTKLTGDGNNIIINGYNVMAYTIAATAKYGASIKSQQITCGDKKASSANGKLNHVNSNVFTITATDSRGYSNSKTITKNTLVNYIKVTCNLSVDAVLDSDSNTTTLNFTVGGKWFNGSFGAITNALTVQYRYKTNNGSYCNWTSLAATKSGNTYTVSESITGLDYQSNYTIEARAFDEMYNNGGTTGLGYQKSDTKTVSAKPVFDWGKDDFSFNVPVKISSPTKHHINGGYALDLSNGDIINCNSFVFADASDNDIEGLAFYRDGTNYDVLKAYNGNIVFTPNYPSNTKEYKMFYTAGDSISISNGAPFCGYITSGSTLIAFTIPIDKPVIASSADITGTILFRGIEGYVYPATKYYTNDNTFRMNLSSPHGFTKNVNIGKGYIYVSMQFTEKLLNSSNSKYANNSPISGCYQTSALKITFS